MGLRMLLILQNLCLKGRKPLPRKEKRSVVVLQHPSWGAGQRDGGEPPSLGASPRGDTFSPGGVGNRVPEPKVIGLYDCQIIKSGIFGCLRAFRARKTSKLSFSNSNCIVFPPSSKMILRDTWRLLHCNDFIFPERLFLLRGAYSWGLGRKPHRSDSHQDGRFDVSCLLTRERADSTDSLWPPGGAPAFSLAPRTRLPGVPRYSVSREACGTLINTWEVPVKIPSASTSWLCIELPAPRWGLLPRWGPLGGGLDPSVSQSDPGGSG